MDNGGNDGELDEPSSLDVLDPEQMDELFAVLADEKRRVALRCLAVAGGTMSFDDLVEEVADETVDGPADRDRYSQMATMFFHVHLPKLESAGLVAGFDLDGDVELSDRLESLPSALFERS